MYIAVYLIIDFIIGKTLKAMLPQAYPLKGTTVYGGMSLSIICIVSHLAGFLVLKFSSLKVNLSRRNLRNKLQN